MPLEIGLVLDQKYRIVRFIGEGGMGAVFEGVNVRSHHRIAVKVLHPKVATNHEAIQRFEREALAVGRIGSDHILKILDLGVLPSGERYMVMEHLDGEPLSARIARQRRLAPRDLAPLIQQVLMGLAAAHEAGIVHRDLKPDNIFIVREKDGQRDFVKLIDFGISKITPTPTDEPLHLTRTGAVMGTPYYLSPEQANGSRDVDARSDIYSVGVILYEAITGRVPFDARTFHELLFQIVLAEPIPPQTVVPDADPAFCSIVMKAMARDPAARFQSCSELARALDKWTHRGLSVTIPPEFAAALASPDSIQPSTKRLPRQQRKPSPVPRGAWAAYAAKPAAVPNPTAPRSATNAPLAGSRAALPPRSGEPAAPEPRTTVPAAPRSPRVAPPAPASPHAAPPAPPAQRAAPPAPSSPHAAPPAPPAQRAAPPAPSSSLAAPGTPTPDLAPPRAPSSDVAPPQALPPSAATPRIVGAYSTTPTAIDPYATGSLAIAVRRDGRVARARAPGEAASRFGAPMTGSPQHGNSPASLVQVGGAQSPEPHSGHGGTRKPWVRRFARDEADPAHLPTARDYARRQAAPAAVPSVRAGGQFLLATAAGLALVAGIVLLGFVLRHAPDLSSSSRSQAASGSAASASPRQAPPAVAADNVVPSPAPSPTGTSPGSLAAPVALPTPPAPTEVHETVTARPSDFPHELGTPLDAESSSEAQEGDRHGSSPHASTRVSSGPRTKPDGSSPGTSLPQRRSKSANRQPGSNVDMGY